MSKKKKRKYKLIEFFAKRFAHNLFFHIISPTRTPLRGDTNVKNIALGQNTWQNEDKESKRAIH